MSKLNEALLEQLKDRDADVPHGSKYELKPCPFCGGRVYLFSQRIIEYDGTSGDLRQDQKTWFITPYCDAMCIFNRVYKKAFEHQPTQWTNDGLRFQTRQEAIDAWNKRGGKA